MDVSQERPVYWMHTPRYPPIILHLRKKRGRSEQYIDGLSQRTWLSVGIRGTFTQLQSFYYHSLLVFYTIRQPSRCSAQSSLFPSWPSLPPLLPFPPSSTSAPLQSAAASATRPLLSTLPPRRRARTTRPVPRSAPTTTPTPSTTTRVSHSLSLVLTLSSPFSPAVLFTPADPRELTALSSTLLASRLVPLPTLELAETTSSSALKLMLSLGKNDDLLHTFHEKRTVAWV